jgi:uncharacterized protein (DUF2147 family)
MPKNWTLLGAFAGLLIAAAPASAQPNGALPPDPTGVWQVEKGYAHIRIVNCGKTFWGVVAWETYPNLDSHNPDPKLRSRPTLGMPILLGMAKTQPNRWDGQIYNSQDGHTYSANISLTNPNTLRVQGCFLAILCGGENWTRVQPAATAVPPSPTSAAAHKASDRAAKPPAPGSAAETDADVCLRLFGPSRLPH